MTRAMLAFLKLIRISNLLIIAGTQCLMRWCIVRPLLKRYSHAIDSGFTAGMQDLSLQLSGGLFAVLVLATVFLAAAGYVINDYFDTKTDRLNRPGTVVVGALILRRTAMKLHLVLSFLGVMLGIYLGIRVGRPYWGFIFILVAGILWFYSTTYKRQFLLGNLIVAFLTAMVPFMVVLYEVPLLIRAYGDLLIEWGINFNLLVHWVLGFSFFAFITTLVREMIKDAEDFEGDRTYGRNTLPVVIGIKWTSAVIITLVSLTILFLAFVWYRFLQDNITLIYLAAALVLPLMVLIVLVVGAREQKHFRRASLLMKGIMLSGLLYSVVANYLLVKMF